jgi:adenylate cyclase
MPERPVQRKLTAILAADIAGYSRLVGLDEEGTLARLRALRALIGVTVAEHRGRIVKTTGDGMLVEFASVVDAVRCAIAIQRSTADNEALLPEDRRIQFRVGINLGDIVVEGDDILGDGVNIAARVEGIAEPGGICISGSAYEHARGKVEAEFADLGEQMLKNIARPIRAYRVVLDRPPVKVCAALPLPDKPPVAVLSFANMSTDPEQGFLADGIAEDVITALSRYPSLFVIARNSCFTYKGRAVEVRQVGRELGVRYVLEGSLRKFGSRIRVTAQLVEAESGNHVLAERYDRDLADIFAVQDEIAEAVTIAIAPTIAEAELRRALRKPPESLDAWAAYQRGLWHLARASADDNPLAEKFFRQAIHLDPNFAGGHRGLGTAYHFSAIHFRTRSLAEVQGLAEHAVRRAIELDPSDAAARAALSLIFMYHADLEAMLAEAERAVSMSPNLSDGHGVKGMALTFSGRPREGVASGLAAIRLDPRGPLVPLRTFHVAVGQYFMCDYEASVETGREAIRARPDFPSNYRYLAAALGQLGRSNEAKEALGKATAMVPTWLTVATNRFPWHRPEDYAHLVEGLRKAGWDG